MTDMNNSCLKCKGGSWQGDPCTCIQPTYEITDMKQKAIELVAPFQQEIGASNLQDSIELALQEAYAAGKADAASPCNYPDIYNQGECCGKTPCSRDTDFEVATKEQWLKIKPSRKAQEIRGSLSFGGLEDHMTDYVWDIVDIAVQTALNQRDTADDGDWDVVRQALEDYRPLESACVAPQMPMQSINALAALDRLRNASRGKVKE